MHNNHHLLDHPVLHHKLGYLRDQCTPSSQFRRLTHELSILLTYEASRSLALKNASITTPKGSSKVKRLERQPVIISIMRAGNEMLAGVLEVLPEASAGHIGIYRDRFIDNTVEYYFRLPDSIEDCPVFLIDPVLATGDTVLATIDRLQQCQVGSITLLTFLASKQALTKLAKEYPEVNVFTVAIEDQLDQSGFLVPGLGDVGNRLYGIKNEQQAKQASA